MRHHLDLYHSKEFDAAKSAPGSVIAGGSQLTLQATEETFASNSPEQMRITQALLLMFVAAKLPFLFLTSRPFRHFMKVVQPRYSIPSKTSFVDQMKAAVSVLKTQIRDQMSSAVAVSFTTDAWSSHRHHYLAITAHYVTPKGQFKECILPLQRLAGSLTGQAISVSLKDACQEFTRKPLDCSYVTTDNASNMAKIASFDVPRISCFAHTINLFLRDLLDEPATTLQISRIRELATTFKNQHAYIEALQGAQSQERQAKSSLLDVKTRWNSTYAMLKRMADLKPFIKSALSRLNDDNQDLSGTEWALCSDLSAVLEIFNDATVACSASSATLHLVVPFVRKFARLLTARGTKDKPDSPGVRALKKKLLDNVANRFEQYEDATSLHSMAMLLHPSTKALAVDATWDAVEAKLRCLTVPIVAPPQEESEMEPPAKRKMSVLDLFADDPCLRTAAPAAKQDSIKEQLDHYKLQKFEGTMNPFCFWVQSRHAMPQLAAFALQVLCAPATEVPCERAFSAAGQFFSDLRNRMKTETLQDLMFLYGNEPMLLAWRNVDYEEEEDFDGYA